MRYYSVEDDLYFFGFSRGAYTARFLAEMLDHIGLLSAGNEELIRFAWKTYAKWASRKNDGSEEAKKEEEELYSFMRGFRETFSRPVRRIRFMGLFDTVNSVPKFESAWMQRSKFPYTARSSAKVIRHAVSIDERRAKFRQDLISGDQTQLEDVKSTPGLHRYNSDLAHMDANGAADYQEKKGQVNKMQPHIEEPEPMNETGLDPEPQLVEDDGFHDAPENQRDLARQKGHWLGVPKTVAKKKSDDSFAAPIDQDSAHLRARDRLMSMAVPINLSSEDLRRQEMRAQPLGDSAQQAHLAKRRRQWSTAARKQDIEEVWFAGGHADIGGGWTKQNEEKWMLSHAPLVWMVHEAAKAGLEFDPG